MQKTSNNQSILEKEEWMEESICLISDYTTKLQSSRQYDIDIGFNFIFANYMRPFSSHCSTKKVGYLH